MRAEWSVQATTENISLDSSVDNSAKSTRKWPLSNCFCLTQIVKINQAIFIMPTSFILIKIILLMISKKVKAMRHLIGNRLA